MKLVKTEITDAYIEMLYAENDEAPEKGQMIHFRISSGIDRSSSIALHHQRALRLVRDALDAEIEDARRIVDQRS